MYRTNLSHKLKTGGSADSVQLNTHLESQMHMTAFDCMTATTSEATAD